MTVWPAAGTAMTAAARRHRNWICCRALEVAGRLANDAAEVRTATAGLTGAGTRANPFDWVTDTDRTRERHTRRVLAAEYPAIPVLGEEYGAAAQAPYRGGAIAP